MPDPFFPPHSTFSLGFWLATVLVGAKATGLGLPESSLPALASYVRDLGVAAHADVLFALVVCAAAQTMMLLGSRWPAVTRLLWGGFVALCVVSVFYAVLSVRIFTYLRSPLSYPLIHIAGDLKNMQSSVGAFVTAPLVTALVSLPLLYVLLALGTPRLFQPKRGPWMRRARVLGVVLLSAYAVAARRATLSQSWIDRDDRLIAESPHWVLVHSSLAELFGGGMVRLKATYPPEDLRDFQIVAERSGAGTGIKLARRPKSVIVLVLESTAARWMSLYGSPYPTTPWLEKEAAHGLVFDNFYCHFGLTTHSMVAITLSIYPGMTWREYTVERPDLPGTTLAEVLRPRGYRTAFLHSGDLAYGNQRGFLANRGFDDLWGFPDLECGPQTSSWGVEDRCLFDGMLRWIDQERGRPFYLLAWTIQTHHPYPPSPGREMIDFFRGDLPPDDYDLGLYLNVLHEVDEQVGRLLDGLRRRGLSDDTLVVITGDHGEAFGSPHDTYGHGRRLYEENVHVPFMLWNPVLFHDEVRSQTIGGHVDLNPTVLDLLGLPLPGSWQGRSLFDTGRPPRAYFYAADHEYMLGVRERNWKYVFDAKRGRESLFDLGHDPDEQLDRASERPDLSRRLRRRLAAWLDSEERHLARLQQASR